MSIAINTIGKLTLSQLPGAFFESAKGWGVEFFPVGIQTIYDASGTPKSLDLEWSNDADAFFQPKAGQSILHVPLLDRFDTYEPDAMAYVREFIAHEEAPLEKADDGRTPFPLAYQQLQKILHKAYTDAQTFAHGAGFYANKLDELAKKLGPELIDANEDNLDATNYLTAGFLNMHCTGNRDVYPLLYTITPVAMALSLASETKITDQKALLTDLAFALRFIQEKEAPPLKRDPAGAYDLWNHWHNVPAMVFKTWREAMPKQSDIYDIIRIFKGLCAFCEHHKARNLNTWDQFFIGAAQFLERYRLIHNTAEANIRLALSRMLVAEDTQQRIQEEGYEHEILSDVLELTVEDPNVQKPSDFGDRIKSGVNLFLNSDREYVSQALSIAAKYLDDAVKVWPDHYSEQSHDELGAYRDRVEALIAEIEHKNANF